MENTTYSFFIILGNLLLAEAVITMPSPRNHLFNLALAFSGNGQSAKFKLFTAINSSIPKSKIQKWGAPAAEF